MNTTVRKGSVINPVLLNSILITDEVDLLTTVIQTINSQSNNKRAITHTQLFSRTI